MIYGFIFSSYNDVLSKSSNINSVNISFDDNIIVNLKFALEFKVINSDSIFCSIKLEAIIINLFDLDIVWIDRDVLRSSSSCKLE